MSKYLLDTHTWVWLMTGDERLPNIVVEKLNAAIPSSDIKVSLVSAWEVSILEAKGRLIFDINCLDWINSAMCQPGITMAELNAKILHESSRLPGDIHGDPFDRALIASARILDLILVTRDKAILEYSKKGFVQTLGY